MHAVHATPSLIYAIESCCNGNWGIHCIDSIPCLFPEYAEDDVRKLINILGDIWSRHNQKPIQLRVSVYRLEYTIPTERFLGYNLPTCPLVDSVLNSAAGNATNAVRDSSPRTAARPEQPKGDNA